MSELEKAARMALEALEEAHWKLEHNQDRSKRAEAITALLRALEQPEEREPCGWRKKHNGEWVYAFSNDAWEFIRKGQPAIKQSLTTEQPAQQQGFIPCHNTDLLTGAGVPDTFTFGAKQPAQQKNGCGRCDDGTKPCDITGGSCASDYLESVKSQLDDALNSLAFYRRRVEALQQWQSKMREPERTIVCDILANGHTLEPAGDRYKQPAQESDDLMIAYMAGLHDSKKAAQDEQRELVQVIAERDYAELVIDALCDAVLGKDRPEWSSAYGYEDAIGEVEERIDVLVLLAQPQPAQQEPVARTDQQIVDQTEELAEWLLGWAFNRQRETSTPMRESTHPMAERCWAAACHIQEMLTATDPENAVAELDDAPTENSPPAREPEQPAKRSPEELLALIQCAGLATDELIRLLEPLRAMGAPEKPVASAEDAWIARKRETFPEDYDESRFAIWAENNRDEFMRGWNACEAAHQIGVKK